MDKAQIKTMLVASQNDMVRMMENAKTQQQAEKAIGNEYAAGFHGGNVMAFEYACKHITNILENMDKQEPGKFHFYDMEAFDCPKCQWQGKLLQSGRCSNCGKTIG